MFCATRSCMEKRTNHEYQARRDSAGVAETVSARDVYWKPGSVSKDGTKALALPYATFRAYQQRLDTLCGLEWSVTYTPWSDRIICHLAGFSRRHPL